MHPGLFWPRHGFLRQPGHFKVKFLQPIEPGMPADQFFKHLIEVTERASDELLVETIRDNPQLKIPESARLRLDQLAAAQAA
jgi:1-acyl-sn-glycerol-3-phosphate acyltransferase